MKKVLITGEGSYIGESFRTYAAIHYPRLEIETVNMKNPLWRDKDFSPYDVVYHVAGIAHVDISHVDEATKEKYYTVNTDLPVEVCKKAKKEGVKMFVYMSSMIVYGDSAAYGKDKFVDEKTVPKAANFYGDSKLRADVAVRTFAAEDFKVLVLRPPMVYGKNCKGNYPILAELAGKLSVFPNVNNKRSMLHIDNLCELLCQVMLIKEMKENAVVLIPQNAEWTKTSDMVKEIAQVRGRHIGVTRILNPIVWLASFIPGKIGSMVCKAFGSSCYVHKVSEYAGIDYQKTTLKESIEKTEAC
jgi:UDP-glucose 4-epimerase